MGFPSFPENVPPEQILFRDPDEPECGITLVGGADGTMTIYGYSPDRTMMRALRHLVRARALTPTGQQFYDNARRDALSDAITQIERVRDRCAHDFTAQRWLREARDAIVELQRITDAVYDNFAPGTMPGFERAAGVGAKTRQVTAVHGSFVPGIDFSQIELRVMAKDLDLTPRCGATLEDRYACELPAGHEGPHLDSSAAAGEKRWPVLCPVCDQNPMGPNGEACARCSALALRSHGWGPGGVRGERDLEAQKELERLTALRDDRRAPFPTDAELDADEREAQSAANIARIAARDWNKS